MAVVMVMQASETANSNSVRREPGYRVLQSETRMPRRAALRQEAVAVLAVVVTILQRQSVWHIAARRA